MYVFLPVLEKKRKIWIWAQVKIIHNSRNPSQEGKLSLLVQKIHSELSSRTHSVTVIGVGSLSFLGDNHLQVQSWLREYLYLVMANGIRTGGPHGFSKRCNSNFHEGSRVWQTPEEGRRTYQPKCCGNNNKDEDNSPKTLNDKNH